MRPLRQLLTGRKLTNHYDAVRHRNVQSSFRSIPSKRLRQGCYVFPGSGCIPLKRSMVETKLSPESIASCFRSGLHLCTFSTFQSVINPTRQILTMCVENQINHVVGGPSHLIQALSDQYTMILHIPKICLCHLANGHARGI